MQTLCTWRARPLPGNYRRRPSHHEHSAPQPAMLMLQLALDNATTLAALGAKRPPGDGIHIIGANGHMIDCLWLDGWAPSLIRLGELHGQGWCWVEHWAGPEGGDGREAFGGTHGRLGGAGIGRRGCDLVPPRNGGVHLAASHARAWRIVPGKRPAS